MVVLFTSCVACETFSWRCEVREWVYAITTSTSVLVTSAWLLAIPEPVSKSRVVLSLR